MEQKLMIQITEMWIHPQLGGTHTSVTRFDNLEDASEYYFRCVEQDKKGGYSDTTIQVVVYNESVRKD